MDNSQKNDKPSISPLRITLSRKKGPKSAASMSKKNSIKKETPSKLEKDTNSNRDSTNLKKRNPDTLGNKISNADLQPKKKLSIGTKRLKSIIAQKTSSRKSSSHNKSNEYSNKIKTDNNKIDEEDLGALQKSEQIEINDNESESHFINKSASNKKISYQSAEN